MSWQTEFPDQKSKNDLISKFLAFTETPPEPLGKGLFCVELMAWDNDPRAENGVIPKAKYTEAEVITTTLTRRDITEAKHAPQWIFVFEQVGQWANIKTLEARGVSQN